MADLLTTILGAFNSGQLGGMPPGMADLPPSGNVQPDPRDMSIQGFPPGGPPLPRPRPPEAGPGMTSAPTAMPADDAGGIMPGPLGGAPMPTAPQQQQGGLMNALGLNNPDTLRSAIQALGGGLKNVRNSPFPGEVFSQAAGGGIEAGGKQDEQTTKDKLAALDRALKLKQINELGSYRDDMTDVRRNQIGVNQQNADTRVTSANNTFVLGKDRNGIRQQDADTRATGTDNRFVLGKERNGISQQRADTAADVGESAITRNNASAGLSDARTKVATGEIDLTEPASKRAARADMASDRFYKPRVTALSQEKMRIQASPMSPQDKQTASAAIDQKMQDLDAQYFQLKEQNRKVHGIGPNGEDLAPRGKGKAPGTAVSPDRPGKFAMGTREDPHEPKTSQDFDAIQPGQVYRDPGDGLLHEK
jgi:hypothetical protein